MRSAAGWRRPPGSPPRPGARGPRDPAGVAPATVEHILADVLSGLAKDFGDAIVGFINDVNFITHTPENLSYNNDLVKHFAAATQVLADGLLAVVVLVGGYNVMLRPYLGSTYAGAREFLPRLVLGGILINTAAWWCRLAIDANNAACGVFGAPTIADVMSDAMRVTSTPMAGVLMVLVVVVMAVLLAIQQLMRLALVDVLLILAPLAALLWILPQSQCWGRLFAGTVFAQAVQVLTLRLGFNLATGLPPLSAAGLLQPMLGIAVLALALKIPGLMGGGGAGGNVVSSVLSTAVGAGVGVGVRAALGVGTRVVSRTTSLVASPSAVSSYRNGGAWSPSITRYPD
jgi:hypothetical protein